MGNAIEYSNTIAETKDFAALASQKREKLHALITAPENERQAALHASAPVAAAYYATLEGRVELADWRAIQGESFHE